MKYITFAVPCYNSESYMEHCIESLLVGGRDVEIIVVDDGSTDNTAKIADIELADVDSMFALQDVKSNNIINAKKCFLFFVL